MSLWWLEPGWTDARCDCCGAVIWPEGDPDHGVCFSCFQRRYAEAERNAEMEQKRNAEADVQYEWGMIADSIEGVEPSTWEDELRAAAYRVVLEAEQDSDGRFIVPENAISALLSCLPDEDRNRLEIDAKASTAGLTETEGGVE